MRPTGTVAFLFADIESSTRLWEQQPQQMPSAFQLQEQILRSEVEARDGYPYKMIGDAFQIAFSTASAALQAAVGIQMALSRQSWGDTPIRVRMAIHVGVTDERGDDYVGPGLNRVARLLSAGHGGQILLTHAAAQLVADELPPDIRLKDLGEHLLKDIVRSEHIFQVLAPGLPVDFPPLRVDDAQRHNLPVHLTTFIGRDLELAELRALLSRPETRMVTLTGPGGTGKTRLSLHVAAALLDFFPAGSWLVELAPLNDPDLVPKAVATVLDVRDMAEKTLTQMLIAHLRTKKLLLVLDNCEHLVEACASLANHLLRRCPQLVILSSSRERLGVDGEVVYRVPSLATPAPQRHAPFEELARNDSMRLFVERAQAALPGFALTPENAPEIVQIVSCLDGIPLAIELAAAKVRVLSPALIASRLGDVFRLLTGGSRAALPRHQTLRALIDWSHDLLSPIERSLWQRLAVFSDGWTIDAAEAVCSFSANADAFPPPSEAVTRDSVVDLVGQLVDKSLVSRSIPMGATPRYRMIEIIRQYAHERLAASPEYEQARAAHLAYYVQLVETGEAYLRARDQVHWMNRLETELGNLRHALDWSIEHEIDLALRMSSAMMWFWHVRGLTEEGIRWIRAGLSRMPTSSTSEVDSAVRAKALLALGALLSQHANAHDALHCLEESCTLYRSMGERGVSGLAYSLRWQATAFRRTRDLTRADACSAEAIQLFKALEDPFGLSECLQVQARPRDAPVEARRIYLQVLALKRQIGDIDGIAFALQMLSQFAFHEGDYLPALEWLEESLECFRAVGNRRFAASDLHTRATIRWALGDYAEALRSIDEALDVSRDTDNHRQYAMSLLRKGEILLSDDEPARSQEVFAAVLPEAQAAHDERLRGLALVGLGQAAYQANAFGTAEEQWRTAQAIGDALGHRPLMDSVLYWQGRSALRQGHQAAAGHRLRTSLDHRLAIGDKVSIAAVLEACASLAVLQTDFERAARLLGAAQRNFEPFKNMLVRLDQRQGARDLAAIHAHLGPELTRHLAAEGALLSDDQIQQLSLSGQPPSSAEPAD